MFRKQQLCDIEDRIEKLELASLSPDITELRLTNSTLSEEVGQIRALLDERIKRLTLAVAEGIEHIDRKEKRIDATITRARTQLKKQGLESDGLEAEAGQLRKLDGAGGEEQGLPAVREALAETQAQASSVPGVSLEQLHRARGIL